MHAKPSFHSLAPNASSVTPNQGKTHTIHTWFSRAPLALRGPRNHDNDTGDVAGGQLWSITCAQRVCKAKFSLLGPKCLVGEAKPRQNTHNPHLVLQGPFGTAEGRETMTTTPEKHKQSTVGFPGPLWHCRGPPKKGARIQVLLRARFYRTEQEKKGRSHCNQ